ncbi:Radical SAM protein [Rhodovastum atsumiense]|uniref:Radical SAM protein n=1 Tax=Rhodovastum atsumiense TaxID=504468 RepID=A0A5M6IVU1_9PROT|nr:radical SAM protein [Rhodovastum atsumiense]KAA5611957.1 radical SAM protein [Rhodovastum atsumiense]CAH2598732.1 Radical SAM protein [Rhodovastum atsumiense]
MPRLKIIQATTYISRDNRRPRKIGKRKMVGAVMPYLAALAPSEWQVMLVDDAVEEIDYDAPVDVVAITVRMVTSLRAYEIADRFRERKVTVLMGGPHATFYSEEMAEHADAVCIGEGEEIFPRMLADAAAGRLQKFYHRDSVACLKGMPTPRWDLLNPKHYVFYRPYVIQHSRGCPYTCDFCAERRLNGDYGYRDRPVEEVVEEIRKCGARHIFFAASQFAGHPGRTMELMEALIPLKVRWSALFSPRFGLDEKFLDLAKRSGLLHVNMGIESISQATLNGMHKQFNKSQNYEAMIENLNKKNISYSFNFVFGTDADDSSVFLATLEFLQRHKVPAAYFNVLAPLRGTGVYEKLKAEDRLIDEPNMDRWPGVFYHFRPVHMSGEELVNQVQKMQREYYSWGSMLRRLRFPRTQADFASWNVNLTQRKVALHPKSMSEFSEF